MNSRSGFHHDCHTLDYPILHHSMTRSKSCSDEPYLTDAIVPVCRSCDEDNGSQYVRRGRPVEYRGGQHKQDCPILLHSMTRNKSCSDGSCLTCAISLVCRSCDEDTCSQCDQSAPTKNVAVQIMHKKGGMWRDINC